MRLLISIVVAAAVGCLLGCAKQDSEPAEQPQPAAEAEMDAQPIASEDFESGDVETVEVQTEDDNAGGDPEETP
jgi:hypothetical protein